MYTFRITRPAIEETADGKKRPSDILVASRCPWNNVGASIIGDIKVRGLTEADIPGTCYVLHIDGEVK